MKLQEERTGFAVRRSQREKADALIAPVWQAQSSRRGLGSVGLSCVEGMGQQLVAREEPRGFATSCPSCSVTPGGPGAGSAYPSVGTCVFRRCREHLCWISCLFTNTSTCHFAISHSSSSSWMVVAPRCMREAVEGALLCPCGTQAEPGTPAACSHSCVRGPRVPPQ